jgi:hypothetical protein
MCRSRVLFNSEHLPRGQNSNSTEKHQEGPQPQSGPNDELGVVVWAPGMFFIIYFIFFSTNNTFLCLVFCILSPAPRPSQRQLTG